MYYIKAIKIKEILFHDRLYCLYDYNINILIKSSDLLVVVYKRLFSSEEWIIGTPKDTSISKSIIQIPFWFKSVWKSVKTMSSSKICNLQGEKRECYSYPV